MSWSLRASMVCLALGGTFGCAGRSENQRQTFGLPSLFAGDSREQRERAAQFDPYPDQDMGPEVVGGRPLDYNRQIPEVDRSRFVGGSAQPVTRQMDRWRPHNTRAVLGAPVPSGSVVVPPPGMAPATTMAPGGAMGPGTY